MADRSKSASCNRRYYLLLKAHYFFSFINFAAFGPIINLILRDRGLTDMQISYINLAIPLLIFLTNPIIGFFTDHTRRFRFIFNLVLSLGNVLIVIMFFLPAIQFYHIQGELRQTASSTPSLVFCASKPFVTNCASKSQCGCTYQASCTSVVMGKTNGSAAPFEFNFNMPAGDTKTEGKNLSASDEKRWACDVNYHVLVNETQGEYRKDELVDPLGEQTVFPSSGRRNGKVADCEIKCSIDHLCHGSRSPRQTIYIFLYSFLFVTALTLFGDTTTIGTSIGFAALHRSNLFGRQRVYGTIGYGLCAFIASRLYARFQSDYVYLVLLVSSGIITVIVSSFVPIRSKNSQTEKEDSLATENLSQSPKSENKEEVKGKIPLLKIDTILPLLKNIDIVMFLATTLFWGTSSGALDPYAMLYIDELSPCQSHAIAGYMTLIISVAEVIALFVSHKLIKRLGTKISSVLIFVAFIVRFCGYYFIRQPYLFLPLETMHFFNFGLLFVLIAQEAEEIAPRGLSGTLQGVVYGITFGLGRAIGLLISMFIYTRMKKPRLFLIYALTNVVGLAIYVVYCFFSKRRSSPPTASEDVGAELGENEEPLVPSSKKIET